MANTDVGYLLPVQLHWRRPKAIYRSRRDGPRVAQLKELSSLCRNAVDMPTSLARLDLLKELRATYATRANWLTKTKILKIAGLSLTLEQKLLRVIAFKGVEIISDKKRGESKWRISQ